VFGNLVHQYGLRRMNVRGYPGAHKTMLLTAVAYNLKKLLKYRPERQLRAYPENNEVVASREHFGVTTPCKIPIASDDNRLRSYDSR
jgi:hypothetical protein